MYLFIKNYIYIFFPLGDKHSGRMHLKISRLIDNLSDLDGY